jgi:hypothetical protein
MTEENQEDVQQQILSFLEGDNGVLLKKGNWEELKTFLQENLTQEQLDRLKELNIHELEIQVASE